MGFQINRLLCTTNFVFLFVFQPHAKQSLRFYRGVAGTLPHSTGSELLIGDRRWYKLKEACPLGNETGKEGEEDHSCNCSRYPDRFQFTPGAYSLEAI